MGWWDQHLEFLEQYGDPRLENYFLMSSPIPTMVLASVYAVFVTKIGPQIMANRKAFELRKLIILYNFIQVLISAYLFLEFAAFWFTSYNFVCQPVDYSNKPEALRIMRAFYLYFLSKFFEFFDTIFFVLRKNNHQITALHVIHHMTVPISVWVGVKFVAGGHATFCSLLNTFVHIVMYAYYMLAAFGPQMQKYLWWKKYITVLQMIQFTVFGIHAMQLYFIQCDFPVTFVNIILGNAMLFLGLFYNFYGSSYSKGKGKGKLKTDYDDVESRKESFLSSMNWGRTFNSLGTMCIPDQDHLFEREKST